MRTETEIKEQLDNLEQMETDGWAMTTEERHEIRLLKWILCEYSMEELVEHTLCDMR